MHKSEFSETQFVIGYTKELFNSLHFPFNIYTPSTREEKKLASDLIIRYYSTKGNYRYSEFYQFKRSKYFDNEVFDSFKDKKIIDTSIKPKYGFNIYNSKKTKQFNVLQKLALQPRCRVYYCAPMFHTVSEFNNYFRTNSILINSKVFPFSQKQLQTINIPLDSNHQIIFDKAIQYICSDPIEIVGLIASERNSFYEVQGASVNSEFSELISNLYELIISELPENQLQYFSADSINFYEVREMLINYFDIYWLLNDGDNV